MRGAGLDALELLAIVASASDQLPPCPRGTVFDPDHVFISSNGELEVSILSISLSIFFLFIDLFIDCFNIYLITIGTFLQGSSQNPGVQSKKFGHRTWPVNCLARILKTLKTANFLITKLLLVGSNCFTFVVQSQDLLLIQPESKL